MNLEPRHHPSWREQQHLIVRPLAPIGRYWPSDIRTTEAVCALVNGVMFSVVRHMPDCQERNYYTEFDDLEGSELKFLAAMMLAVCFDGGVVAPSPTSISFAVDRDGDLLNDVFVNEIGRALPTALASSFPVYTRPLINCSGNEGYSLHHTALYLDRLSQIVSALRSEDDLVLRGLYVLLKAQMLSMHAEFAEEANYVLYVALDVLFALTRRRLKRLGNVDPSSIDAQAYLQDEPVALLNFHDARGDADATLPWLAIGKTSVVEEHRGKGIMPAMIALWIERSREPLLSDMRQSRAAYRMWTRMACNTDANFEVGMWQEGGLTSSLRCAGGAITPDPAEGGDSTRWLARPRQP